MKEYLKQNGFEFRKEKGQALLTGRLGAYANFVETGVKAPYSDKENKRLVTRYLTQGASGQVDWYGGDINDLRKDLSGHKDMRPFLKARTKLEKSSLGQKLLEGYTDCQPRRTRIKSEHDGEWVESRRFDVAPWDGVKKAQGGGRFMEIIAYSNVLASSSAQEINSYGCLVWAITDLIESMGINVKLTLRYDSNFCCGYGTATRMTLDVLVKDAGEYIAPSLIAAACQSNFYRRGIFATKCALAEAWGKTIDSGMGTSIQQKPIEFKEGQLILGPNVKTASDEEIEKVLLQSIAA